MINAEWIRNMTNDELAKWLDELGVMVGDCPHECCKNVSKILKWLESEQN